MNGTLEKTLLNDLIQIIEQGKHQLVKQVNSAITLVYWHVGKRINDHILHNKRAAYGQQVIPTLAEQLSGRFGRSFTERNLQRMMQFANEFPDLSIVTSLMSELSWTHFIQLFNLNSPEQKLYYARKASEERWSVRKTITAIQKKTFERSTLANLQISNDNEELNDTFKDPYFLDFLGLRDGYLESDLEAAIIRELENFILELGNGFTFVERQKRIILDGKDFYLDLLFYHRKLKRLVAIELKIDDFKPSYKGQMELYLKWLNRHERLEGENSPVGLILCAGKNTEQIELLEMHKDGIMVAEYWTELPPKAELENKLHELIIEAKERLERLRYLES